MKKTKTSEPIRTVDEYAQRFGAQFKVGTEGIKAAADIYVEAIWKYPDEARSVFATAYPGLGRNSWDLLERIGNGDLNPNAMLLPYVVAKRVSKMPIEVQDRIFDRCANGCEVVSRTTFQPRIVPITSPSMKASELLIDEDKGRVRSVREQRRLLLAQQKGQPKVDPDSKDLINYRIKGNVVRIGTVEVGLATLRKIVAEMERILGIGK